ncbi:MAG: ATP-dependent DNA ligase [Actinomycetota bacterium]
MPKRTIAGDLPAPMLAKLQPETPTGDGWTYEPKWDGFRTIVAVDDGGSARLVSRDGRPLGRYFPELVSALEIVANGSFVADGEIVRVADGSMDFDELQLRLHPAESRVRKLAGEIPASLVVFDLLRESGEDLTALSLAERRERLVTIAQRLDWPLAPGDLALMPSAPVVLVAPFTGDVAVCDAWFADEAGLGQDGVLAKRDDQPYLSGERGWVKVKHRRTLDTVVGGYRLSKAGAKSEPGIGALLLGLYDDDGTLHYVGHTSSFKAAERREILGVLRELEGGESFGGGRAPGGPSRWSAGKDPEWVAIEPVLVCEVTIDRMQYGRFRHAATFVRWREDREPKSCTFDQLGVSPPEWPDGDYAE